MNPRYAIYFAPQKHAPWWDFGSHWLGRDEWDNVVLTQPTLPDFAPDEQARVTAEPRRYGFHATLKAPFRLSGGHTAQDLLARLHGLAATLKPVRLSPLLVTALGNFVALTPCAESTALQALAAACVTELDDLRAPPTDADLQRRRIDPLDARGHELLQRYGYPHVLERFRLHLTLSGSVAADVQQRLIYAVSPEIDRLNALAPLVLDRLCLFVESAPGAAFLRVADVPVGA